ncbi:MAG TPA: fibronectin type III domain-containing protein, partial [Terriglobales bacterium]|nr:fibronectin type III domain-containing protein [Terriglobales bacterium]
MGPKGLRILVALLLSAWMTGCGGGAIASGGGSNSGGGGGGGTAPAAPTGVTATAGNQQVALTWTASAGATSYKVKRGTTSGGPYTQVGAPTAASYADNGLSNGSKYYYVVSAVNAAGESGNSGEVSATPASAVAIPPVPTGVTATAGNQQVALTWTASAGATSYKVKRG